jgi:hypothetical protein
MEAALFSRLCIFFSTLESFFDKGKKLKKSSSNGFAGYANK